MVNVAFQLGDQVNEDLEYSPKFSSIAYDSLLIMGMGGSGVAGDVLSLLSSEVSSKNIIVRKTYSIPKKTLEASTAMKLSSKDANGKISAKIAKSVNIIDCLFVVTDIFSLALERSSFPRPDIIGLTSGVFSSEEFGRIKISFNDSFGTKWASACPNIDFPVPGAPISSMCLRCFAAFLIKDTARVWPIILCTNSCGTFKEDVSLKLI